MGSGFVGAAAADSQGMSRKQEMLEYGRESRQEPGA